MHVPWRSDRSAAERRGNFKGLKGSRLKDISSQGRNLALTVLHKARSVDSVLARVIQRRNERPSECARARFKDQREHARSSAASLRLTDFSQVNTFVHFEGEKM